MVAAAFRWLVRIKFASDCGKSRSLTAEVGEAAAPFPLGAAHSRFRAATVTER